MATKYFFERFIVYNSPNQYPLGTVHVQTEPEPVRVVAAFSSKYEAQKYIDLYGGKSALYSSLRGSYVRMGTQSTI